MTTAGAAPSRVGTAPADPFDEPSDEPLWVFGYGSLVWRMDLPFEERLPAAVLGYERRFFQLSPDHRGTESAPGRVVTVVAAEASGAKLAGVVYRIGASHRADVLQKLDHRERAGYERITVTARGLHSPREITALMYIGKPDNPGFSPASDDEIARVVAFARGPSGENLEYVERLDEALTELGHPDPHVAAIAALARAQRADAGLPLEPVSREANR